MIRRSKLEVKKAAIFETTVVEDGLGDKAARPQRQRDVHSWYLSYLLSHHWPRDGRARLLLFTSRGLKPCRSWPNKASAMLRLEEADKKAMRVTSQYKMGDEWWMLLQMRC